MLPQLPHPISRCNLAVALSVIIFCSNVDDEAEELCFDGWLNLHEYRNSYDSEHILR